MQLPIFPQAGFDQSVTTPVLLGVLVSWAATELFGWVFAGLVVPGYLAAVFLLDPAGGIIDVFEAVVTYVAARIIGEHLARTGVTSRVFGRERFFLVVLISILVRLAVEGLLLPKVAPHATWAFSIGLVVVPLTANACWKTGLARGFLQNGVPTLVVYLLLRYIFVKYTNLSLEGFELATENVAASFLSSPQAYILLLTGAVLAAAANVKYGWDFNGILVPALIGLVVTEPVKLAATFVEAVVLLFAVQLIVRITPLKRANIEGPRRTVLFFTVDYALRYTFAFVVGRHLPGDDIVSLMGFGYLLPTLLAVKMSQRQSVALVLLPAAKVSVASFAVGTMIGFLAHSADSLAKTPPPPIAREMPEAPKDPARAALWVAATALESAPNTEDRVLPSAEEVTALVQGVLAGRALAQRDPMVESRLGGGVVLLRERWDKLDHRAGLPSILARPIPSSGRVILFVPSPSREPEVAYAAGRFVAAGMADAAVLSGVEEAKPSFLETIADDVAHRLANGDTVLVMREGRFSLYGVNLNARVQAIAKNLSGADAVARPIQGDALITIPNATIDGWIDRELPPTYITETLQSATALSLFIDAQIPHGLADRQSPEDQAELRKFALVPLLGRNPFLASRALPRLVADALGYKLLETAPAPGERRALALVPTKAPRPLLVVVRDGGGPRVVEAPHAGRTELRDFAVRAAYAIDARAIVLGLFTSAGHVYHYDAFRSAHTASSELSPATILVREGIDAQGVVAIGAWGPGSEATATQVKQGLTSLGFVVADKALDPQAREIAARTVLGQTHLVGVTVDSFALQVASLDEARAAHRAFGDRVPFLDGKLSTVAADLFRIGPTAEAPNELRGWVLSAAQEQSVVARRSLNEMLAAGKIRAAFVRTDKGQFLLVVSRHGATAYVTAVALHPRELAATAPAPRDAFAGCEEVLTASGSCEVKVP